MLIKTGGRSPQRRRNGLLLPCLFPFQRAEGIPPVFDIDLEQNSRPAERSPDDLFSANHLLPQPPGFSRSPLHCPHPGDHARSSSIESKVQSSCSRSESKGSEADRASAWRDGVAKRLNTLSLPLPPVRGRMRCQVPGERSHKLYRRDQVTGRGRDAQERRIRTL